MALELPLCWSVHLASGEGRKKAACAVLVILCAAAAAFFVLQGFFPALIIAFVLTASVSDFLFPVHFKISAETASSRSLFSHQIIRWSDVKAAYILEKGVKLSPFARKSRLEPFRGVFLRFSDNSSLREQVIEAIKMLKPESVIIESVYVDESEKISA